MTAENFATFEKVWQALWAYIYKVLEFFGYKDAE